MISASSNYTSKICSVVAAHIQFALMLLLSQILHVVLEGCYEIGLPECLKHHTRESEKGLS